MNVHRLALQSSWAGGLTGRGELRSEHVSCRISAPAELGGSGLETSPEELLLAAAANCYLITLAAILDKRKWDIAELSVTSEAVVLLDGSPTLTAIWHKPTVYASGLGDDDIRQMELLAGRAERACMISKALQGNVEITVAPVTVRTPRGGAPE